MATTNWALEASHSEVQFKVRHMMISNVTGHFNKFDATVVTEGDDVTTANVQFSADVNSVSTNNEQRDGHLKSADFFDAGSHPQITFTGSGMEKASDDTYKMHGQLTMRGVTHPVTLNVEFGGIAKDPWGNVRAGFTVEGKLNRKDYGLAWTAITEAGGIVVGDEVKLMANVEFVKS